MAELREIKRRSVLSSVSRDEPNRSHLRRAKGRGENAESDGWETGGGELQKSTYLVISSVDIAPND